MTGRKKKGGKTFWILLGILALIIVVGVILTATHKTAPAPTSGIATSGPQSGSWYANVIDFLGLGETWAMIITSLMILLIVFVALKDILSSFSLFRNQIVILLISLGVAVIASVAGAARTLAAWLLSATAIFGTFGIIIGIAVPIVIFIMINIAYLWFFKGVMDEKISGNVEANTAKVVGAVNAIAKVQQSLSEAGEE